MKRLLALLLAFAGFAAVAAAQNSNASYPGGEKALNDFITKTMVYPKAAADNGVEGTVVLIFVVKADGTIGNIKVSRMVDPDLEAEAIRIVRKMPKWTPATNNGTPVDSHYTQRFNFKLGK